MKETMKNPPAFNAWKLYWNMFQDGDEVVIITEDDKMAWGEIKARGNGCWLKRYCYKDKFFDWDEIRFMAHDGFPVRKLMGADGSKNIEKLQTEDVQNQIREGLGLEYEEKKLKRIVYSDPFMIDSCKAKLVNKGNVWVPGSLNLHEEVLLLKSDDGAKGMLWGCSLFTMYVHNN